MPLILLLTGAISVTSQGGWFARNNQIVSTVCINIEYIRAYLLMYCLLKLIIVDNSSHLPITIAGPEWSGHLYLRLTHISPG